MPKKSWIRFGYNISRDLGLLHRTTRAVARRLYSSAEAVALKRDLTASFQPPPASIDFTVRPIADRDIWKLFDHDVGEGWIDAKWDRAARRRLLDAGFGTCYVAVTDQDEPCFVEWVIGPEHNRQIERYFGGAFPPLADDEVLMESAFTPIAFRGRGVMPAACSKIAECAAERGARWAISFVGIRNVPSLKGFIRSGFYPFARCTQTWTLLRCRPVFRPPEGWDLAMNAADRSTPERRREVRSVERRGRCRS